MITDDLWGCKAAGIKTFACNVTPGTERDAVWLSFSANKAHGRPRDRGVVRDIIEKKILADEEWINKSHSEIAAHVGVSRRRVSQLIVEISRQKDSDVGNISHTGNSDSTNSDMGTGCNMSTMDSRTPKLIKKPPYQAKIKENQGFRQGARVNRVANADFGGPRRLCKGYIVVALGVVENSAGNVIFASFQFWFGACFFSDVSDLNTGLTPFALRYAAYRFASALAFCSSFLLNAIFFLLYV